MKYILNYLGLVPKEELSSLEAANTVLRRSVSQLENEQRVYELEIQGLTSRLKRTTHVVDIGLEDPEPIDEKVRVDYVIRAATDFDDYFEKKILKMISEIREVMDQPSYLQQFFVGLPRVEYDWYLRGTSNGLRLLLEWGDQMRNERESYKQKDNQ